MYLSLSIYIQLILLILLIFFLLFFFFFFLLLLSLLLLLLSWAYAKVALVPAELFKNAGELRPQRVHTRRSPRWRSGSCRCAPEVCPIYLWRSGNFIFSRTCFPKTKRLLLWMGWTPT